MHDVDSFVIDDDFDPLADLDLASGDTVQETDYLPPIPDADKSVMPRPVFLTDEERLERLLAGIPGQQFRILHAIELCMEPKTMGEVVEALDADYPQMSSVYTASQIVGLLTRDGALRRMDGEPASAKAPDVECGYVTVSDTVPSRYVATQVGLDFMEARVSQRMVQDMLEEEPRYLPLYRMILERCMREGGGETKALNDIIDANPLCQEPRRFCTYFLNRLEGVGALAWRDSWTVTDRGSRCLADMDKGEVD